MKNYADENESLAYKVFFLFKTILTAKKVLKLCCALCFHKTDYLKIRFQA